MLNVKLGKIGINACKKGYRYAFTVKYVGSEILVKACIANDIGSVIPSINGKCKSNIKYVKMNNIGINVILPFLITDKGLHKTVNEDSVGTLTIKDCVDGTYLHIFAIADGVSSLESGHQASKLAVWGFITSVLDNVNPNLEFNGNLEDIIWNIHDYIRKELNGNAGTTIVAGYLKQGMNEAVGSIAYVGDTAAFKISESSIEKLTDPDDRIEEHMISQAIGYTLSNVHLKNNIKLKVGDYLVLATDGVADYVDRKQMVDYIQSLIDPRIIRIKLIEHARTSGSHDDATAAILWFYGTSHSKYISEPTRLLRRETTRLSTNNQEQSQ